MHTWFIEIVTKIFINAEYSFVNVNLCSKAGK